ncbi:MAG: VWA domain-containing protein [Synergistaceae bacterium]|nr:VWA domain-containing protein [Synergistaceae bacterium]MBP9626874.1 VWA domain-containing protein [Synergistaceae bacterium]MBP9957897.1 VWA domain-containing protein [Synergistaceae bacterium]
MTRLNKRFFLFFAVAAILLLSALAYASDFDKVIPHQVVIQDGKLTAYFDILNGNGESLLRVQESQVKMTFDKQNVKTDLFRPFSQTGWGVASVLLVDTSLSMTPEHFEKTRKALSIWVDSMTTSDRVALITFGSSVNVLTKFTADQQLLRQLIGSLTLNYNDSNTNFNDAVIEAFKLATVTDEGLPNRRVIVALSDGIHQATVGATREEVLKQIKDAQIPFHSITYFKIPQNEYEKKRILEGKEALSTFSRISGGAYYDDGRNMLAEAYAGINARIRNSYVMIGDISGIQPDGQFHRMQLDYTTGTTTQSEGMDVRYSPSQGPQGIASKLRGIPLYAILGVCALLLVGGSIYFRKASNKKTPVQPVPKEVPPVQPGQNKQPQVRMASQPSGVQISLTPLGVPNAKPHVVTVADRVEMGRGKQCAISVDDDPSISSRHCEISWNKGFLYIRDIGSTNGTNVNGVPISGQFKLSPGDTINLGKAQFRLGEIKEI